MLRIRNLSLSSHFSILFLIKNVLFSFIISFFIKNVKYFLYKEICYEKLVSFFIC